MHTFATYGQSYSGTPEMFRSIPRCSADQCRYHYSSTDMCRCCMPPRAEAPRMLAWPSAQEPPPCHMPDRAQRHVREPAASPFRRAPSRRRLPGALTPLRAQTAPAGAGAATSATAVPHRPRPHGDCSPGTRHPLPFSPRRSSRPRHFRIGPSSWFKNFVFFSSRRSCRKTSVASPGGDRHDERAAGPDRGEIPRGVCARTSSLSPCSVSGPRVAARHWCRRHEGRCARAAPGALPRKCGVWLLECGGRGSGAPVHVMHTSGGREGAARDDVDPNDGALCA